LVQKNYPAVHRTVRVFDEHGTELQPTYLRRAKGLIKHGRASWTGSGKDAIRLCVLPTNFVTEDNTMSDTNINETIIEKDAVLEVLIKVLGRMSDLIAESTDTEQLTIYAKLYTDTLDLIKDLKKQNQEVELAKLKKE